MVLMKLSCSFVQLHSFCSISTLLLLIIIASYVWIIDFKLDVPLISKVPASVESNRLIFLDFALYHVRAYGIVPLCELLLGRQHGLGRLRGLILGLHPSHVLIADRSLLLARRTTLDGVYIAVLGARLLLISAQELLFGLVFDFVPVPICGRVRAINEIDVFIQD